MIVKRGIKKARLSDHEVFQLFAGTQPSCFQTGNEMAKKKKLGLSLAGELGRPNQHITRKRNFKHKISENSRRKILGLLRERKNNLKKKADDYNLDDNFPKLRTSELEKVIQRSKASVLDSMRLFSNLEILVWKIDSVLNHTRNRDPPPKLIERPKYFRIMDQWHQEYPFLRMNLKGDTKSPWAALK